MKVNITKFKSNHFLRHLVGSAIAVDRSITEGMTPASLDVEIIINGKSVDPLALCSVLERSVIGASNAHDTFTFLFLGKGPFRGPSGKFLSKEAATAQVQEVRDATWVSRARSKMLLVSRTLSDVAFVLDALGSSVQALEKLQEQSPSIVSVVRQLRSTQTYAAYLRDSRKHFSELAHQPGN